MRSRYGKVPYGLGPYGREVVIASISSVVPVSPPSGGTGVPRRPRFVVVVLPPDGAAFDLTRFSLSAGGLSLVVAGVPAVGWTIRVIKVGTAYRVIVEVSDYATAAYLPASALVSAQAAYNGVTANWAFTTVAPFLFTKIEAIADSLVRVWFNRPPADNNVTRNPSSHSFVARGNASPVSARAVRYNAGDLFILLPLARSIQKTGLYTFKTALTDVNGESVE
jgi:hypothetical protein